MATVRIYKVAELLGTSSQEVMALLKQAHGIEVKSASSTIEEVVARQFVERLARQRGVSLPSPAQMFADAPPPPKGKKAGGKAPEPPKPTAPPLPPPRLIKTIRPYPPAPVEGEPDTFAATPAATQVTWTPSEAPWATDDVEPTQAETAHLPAVEDAPAAVAAEALAETATLEEPPVVPPAAAAVEAAAQEPLPVEAGVVSEVPDVVAEAPGTPAHEATELPAAASPAAASAATVATPAAPMRPVAPQGRLVPPQIRLRIEDPASPRVEGPTRPASRSPRGGQAPPAPRPASQAPIPEVPRQPLGGPRPLPSAPVRTPPGGISPAGLRSPLSPYTRPTYAPTGYVAPGQRPALAGQPSSARPGGPAAPATGRPGGPPRPSMQRRPSGQRQKGHQIRSELQTISSPQMQAGPPPVTRTISLAEGMTVKDLADKLEVKVKDVLKKLIEKRMMMTINSTVDSKIAMMIAREFGAEIQMRSFEEELVEHQVEISKPEDLVERAPVVTVMGHVDHGKTTLLDAIRETRVAEREAGGITQHIGAYAVDVNKRKVVFLDTPGHEAFTMMRARGARVTDVVILVVAADDGVMPQTKEAIDHARAANVPILVAVNKIDKPEANQERVKKELSDLGLMPEEWGGTTVTVPVSAKKRQNIESLLEMILLVTEMSELKANPKRDASGTVLEAKLDRGRGSVATVLVQDGSLKVGDTFIAGPIVSKVRALIDDRGRNVRSAGPSTPVEVLGLDGLPAPGDTFQVINDPAKARQIAMYRQLQAKERTVVRAPRTLEDIQKQLKEGSLKELALIIKADVGGSAEVLADTLQKLSDEQVKIRIILSGVGAINESDVQLAMASEAIIIGFNVRPSRDAAELAEREHVDIRLHSVIYNVTDEMRKAMAGLLEPTFKEVRLGHAEIRQLFKVPKAGTVAGCMVSDGVIKRSGGAQARLLRDGKVVHEGPLGSLKRFKDDVVGGQVRLRVRPLLRALQRPQARRRGRGVHHRARRGAGIVARARLSTILRALVSGSGARRAPAAGARVA